MDFTSKTRGRGREADGRTTTLGGILVHNDVLFLLKAQRKWYIFHSFSLLIVRRSFFIVIFACSPRFILSFARAYHLVSILQLTLESLSFKQLHILIHFAASSFPFRPVSFLEVIIASHFPIFLPLLIAYRFPYTVIC